MASDGHTIRYHLQHTPNRPWLVFCNGIGASTRAWKRMFAHFQGKYSILYWDYRGLHNERVSLTIERHGADAWNIIQQEQIEDFFLIGWSMGVQVGLSLFHQGSPSVKKMVLLNGAAGKSVTQLLQRENWFLVKRLCSMISKSGKYIHSLGPYLAKSKPFLSNFTTVCLTMNYG